MREKMDFYAFSWHNALNYGLALGGCGDTSEGAKTAPEGGGQKIAVIRNLTGDDHTKSFFEGAVEKGEASGFTPVRLKPWRKSPLRPMKEAPPISCGLSSSAVGGIDSKTEILSDAAGDKLAQYTFRMLYNSIDVNTAVAHLPEIDKLDENHTFYCKDIRELHLDLYGILALQGICSVLQCAIMDDGVFRDYAGFDEYRENRAWTKQQIASLTLISNVLSTFLLKLRLKEGLPGYGEGDPK